MGATDRKTNSDETPLHSLESQKHQYKDGDWDWAPNGVVVFFCRSDAALPFHYISFRKLAKSASNYSENLCFSFPLCPTKSERDNRHA